MPLYPPFKGYIFNFRVFSTGFFCQKKRPKKRPKIDSLLKEGLKKKAPKIRLKIKKKMPNKKN